MTVIPILLLCSLGLVGAALALFVFSVRQGDCDRSERLCLLPLEDDDAVPADREMGSAAQETSESQPLH